MKRTLLIALLIATFSAFSQEPDPMWELSLNPPTLESDFLPTNMVELSDGSIVVPMISSLKESKSNNTKIFRITDNGEISNEVSVEYDSNYTICDIAVDLYDGKVNVFSHLLSKDFRSAKIVHHFLHDDFSLSAEREIYTKVFDTLTVTDGYNHNNAELGKAPLIDKDGNRTFMYAYTSWLFFDPPRGMYINLVKIDKDFNIITENWLFNEDYNNFRINYGVPSLTYNNDSTDYYLTIQASKVAPNIKPSNLQFVFDLDLNYRGYYYDYNCWPEYPEGSFQAYAAVWRQSPYTGDIYGFGTIEDPTFDGDIFACKLDQETQFADLLYCTNNSTGNITSGCREGNSIAFSPDGVIYGVGVYNYHYDINEFYFVENTCVCYIAVLDKGTDKIEEWYYQKGENYNHFFSNIFYTEDGNVIISGELRHKEGENVYHEPYIVKFDAKFFTPDNIEEAHANGLKLAIAYPNPGGDVMNVRTTLRNATLSVYDMQGRIVHQEEINGDVTSIDASRWTKGTYVWKVETENGSKVLEEGKWVK